MADTHDHDHGHHHQSFISKYVFSTDHKWIGIQYAVTALCFLLFGFSLMMIMRYQLANPGMRIPFFGSVFGGGTFFDKDGGYLLPEAYNMFGAMHGTIMVFLGVVPLAVGGFGNFVTPLQV